MPETKNNDEKTAKATAAKAKTTKPKAKARTTKPKAKAKPKPKTKAAAKPKAKTPKAKVEPKAEAAKAPVIETPEVENTKAELKIEKTKTEPKIKGTKAEPKIEKITAKETKAEATEAAGTADPMGKGGVLDTLSTGLKVLGGELKWTVKDFVTGYETKQMRRRLDDEYAALGRLAHAAMEAGETALPGRDGEAGVILAQIEFLQKEIGFLDSEHDKERAMDMQRRKKSLDGQDD